MLKVVAAVSGRKAVALLPFDAAHYKRVSGLSWFPSSYSSGQQVQLWLGHAPILFADDGSETGLRAVHLAPAAAKGGAPQILPGWLLAWNGCVGARVESVRLEALSADDGEGLAQLQEPLPVDVYDGTFVGLALRGPASHVADAPLPSYAACQAILDGSRLSSLPGAPFVENDAKGAYSDTLLEALAKVTPYVDDEPNVGAQASPGSFRTVRSDVLAAAVARMFAKASDASSGGKLPGSLAEFAPWGLLCSATLAQNALQDGRRRLHYFTIGADNGLRFLELGAGSEWPQWKIHNQWGLVGPGQPTFDDHGKVLVGAQRVPIVNSAEEQHAFRLAVEVDTFEATANPVAWVVSHGILNHHLTTPLVRNPTDANGNQRRLWIVFSLARWLRRWGKAPWAKARCEEVVQAIANVLGKLDAWKGEATTTAGPVAYLSENMEVSRGHHGANVIGFEVAVQVIALGELELALPEAGIAADDVSVPIELVRSLRRHAARGLWDLCRIRREHAPRDEGPWGEGMRGCPAYDVATRPSKQLEAGAVPGTWWHSQTGGGRSATYTWCFEAMALSAQLDIAQGLPLDPERAEDLRQTWLAFDSLRPHDTHFPEFLPTALLLAPLARLLGWSQTGFRDA